MFKKKFVVVCLLVIVFMSFFASPSIMKFIRHIKMRGSMSLNQHAIFSDYLYGVNLFCEDIGAGDSKYFLFRPPRGDTSEYRCFPTVEVNGDFGHLSWTFAVNPDSVSDPGDPCIATTRNIEFPKVSRMKCYTNSVFSSTDSIHLNRGMTPQTGPQSSANPFTASDDFFWLGPEYDYFFRLENRGNVAGHFVVNFRWYEIRPNIGLRN